MFTFSDIESGLLLMPVLDMVAMLVVCSIINDVTQAEEYTCAM
jgi:hypothetical protein